MSTRQVFHTIFGMAVLPTLVVLAHAQMTEPAARAQASDTVRSQLRSTVDFKPDQFLGVRRDEELEQLLAVATGGRTVSMLIYRVSPTGYEIRKNTVIYQVWTDFDPGFIVAINPSGGATYRIHGFGVADSLAEFERLINALRVHVAGPDEAESLADFYRMVNPENHESLTPISSLIELKQAAERQCQTGANSFEADQEAFSAWWKHAKPMYEKVSFKQTAAPLGRGYLVEWIVLSSAGKGNCGGAPLRARLEVSSDGHVGRVTFSPLPKG